MSQNWEELKQTSWGYITDEDSSKANSNCEGPEVGECLTNSRHIKETRETRAL